MLHIVAVLYTRNSKKSAKRLYRAEGGYSQSGPFLKYSAAFDCFPWRCSQYLERVVHPMSRCTLLHCVFHHQYHARTGSRQAEHILKNWGEIRRGRRLRKVLPLAVARAMEDLKTAGTNAG